MATDRRQDGQPLVFARSYLAYRELADQIAAQIPMRVLEREDMGFEEIVSSGDLGFKVQPMETSP